MDSVLNFNNIYNPKLCVAIKHFLFHYFQRFGFIVDIFYKSQKSCSNFFTFINEFYYTKYFLKLIKINLTNFMSKLMPFNYINIFHLLSNHFDI